MKRGIVFCAIFTIVMLTITGAQSGEVTKTGTTAAKFLSISVGPRAVGMGGAFTAIVNDVTSMYWNPAGMAQLTRNELGLFHTNWIADVNFNFFGLAIPVSGLGVVGLNVTALTMDEMERTTEYMREGTGEKFSAGSYAVGISLARYLTDNFAIGANLKYIREEIYNSAAQGIAIDIGTIFTTPFYGVRFASSISNFGTKMQITGDDLLVQYDPDPTRQGNNESVNARYETDEFDLPLNLRIGIARDFTIFGEQRLTLAVDASHPNDNSENVNIGGELAFFDEMVFLRGGYKSLFLKDSIEKLTLGAGFQYAVHGYFKAKIDYAYQTLEFLGDIHKFGIILNF